MTEIEIRDVFYKTGKMDAFRQLHLVRRLAPAFGRIMAIAEGDAAGFGTQPSDLSMDRLAQALGDAIYALKDEDTDFVIKTCLAVCRRRDTDGRWTPVIRDGHIMFEEMDLFVMIRLVAAVIQDNLRAFSESLPSDFRKRLETMISGLHGQVSPEGRTGFSGPLSGASADTKA